MEGVGRGVAGLDARRVRFHDLSADHGADRQGIRRSLNRGHCGVHDHPVMRLLGATAAGWMADRMGRKTPLMISILWYSLCNFIAGFSPTFAFLFFFRALLGIGMGAEWPAGAALAMESWPPRSRGFMSGILQGSWGLGFALSALAYGFLYAPLEAWHKGYGWRGMLILGVLPALACVWIRMYVKEPAVWAE